MNCPDCGHAHISTSTALIQECIACGILFDVCDTPRIRNKMQNSAVLTMDGVSELLEVYEDKVAITPQGVIGLMAKGIKGTKIIPFTSITAIQFKEAGAVFSGYLQLTIPGGNESTGGLFAAAIDENTFMFAGKENNDLAIVIKEYIELRMRELRTPKTAQPSQLSTSLADELQKLAKLRDQGILSDNEFQVAKEKCLNN